MELDFPNTVSSPLTVEEEVCAWRSRMIWSAKKRKSSFNSSGLSQKKIEKKEFNSNSMDAKDQLFTKANRMNPFLIVLWLQTPVLFGHI